MGKILSLCSALVRHIWSAKSSPGFSSMEGKGKYGLSPEKGHKDYGIRASVTWGDVVELWLFILEKGRLRKDLFNVCKYLMWSIKETRERDRLFSIVYQIAEGKLGTNWNTEKFSLNTREPPPTKKQQYFLAIGTIELCIKFPREIVGSSWIFWKSNRTFL